MLLELLLTPSLLFPLQDETGKAETPEVEVAETLPPGEAAEAIQTALKGKDFEVATATLETQGLIADKRVTKAVAGGLKHKQAEVRIAALKALRYNTDKSAFDYLLKSKKNKLLTDDDKVAAEYYYALGQKEDKRATPILTDGLRTGGVKKAMQARILSLGRIREKESAEELMSLLVSGRGRRESHPNMNDIRTAMIVLTGEDQGRGVTEWIQWWNDNKRSLKITADPHELPRNYQRRWTMLWATPEEKEKARQKIRDAFEDGAEGEDAERGRGKGRRKRDEDPDTD